MKRPEETMRALSREELEQMLQNDFLMASSCDAEQVVQVVEELMAREGQSEAVRRARTSASLEAFWKRYEGERGAAGINAPTTAEEKGMDGGSGSGGAAGRCGSAPQRGTRGCSRSTAHGRRRTARR